MFTRILLSDTPSPLLTASHSTGVRLKGNSSGAVGFLFSVENADDGTSSSVVNLVNVSGTFTVGVSIVKRSNTDIRIEARTDLNTLGASTSLDQLLLI